jgi:MFS family permease
MVSDRGILYACAVLRSLGTSLLGVLLGIYLARLQLTAAAVGLIVGVGLAGGAAAALLVTIAGDRFGRRRMLLALALLGALGTTVVATSTQFVVLATAAFVGMLNGMGRDRGAALILDQAILPATTGDLDRTRGFAWYNVLQDVGHAVGALLAAAPVLLHQTFELEELTSIRVVVMCNALLLLASAVLYWGLSPAAEAPVQALRVPVSADSRRAVWRISALFGIDSLAGGFLTASLLSFFFFERFGASEAMIGLLFFGARIANAASHLGAAWLASRIGLINTMVFTHIPSSFLLMTVAFAPNFPIAAALFLLREGLVEMDVPTRQSYVMAIVRPEERTFAAGITNLVRLGGWAIAPAFAGLLMQGASLVAPLFVGAGMKISYDVLLFMAFRHRRPPEERSSPSAT